VNECSHIYLSVERVIYICMGCGSSVADASSPLERSSERRLAVCSNPTSLNKDDIVLIVRSARVLEVGEDTVCVQFNNRDGMSFEWISSTDICAVLNSGG
jgi:DNA-directed RNA polymerase subunit RPC12/RpoP